MSAAGKLTNCCFITNISLKQRQAVKLPTDRCGQKQEPEFRRVPNESQPIRITIAWESTRRVWVAGPRSWLADADADAQLSGLK